MAEVTAFRNNALPYPIYGQPWAVVYPILDADGDLVTAATAPDAERSLNGDTFADCTNESVEIATGSGVYYLLLTAAEMTADIVTVIAKTTTSGAKTTVLTLYPRKLVSLRTGTSQTGAAGSITLDSGASGVDDYYNGCVCAAVIDGNTELRVITDYVGSTKVASVTPNWNVTPDVDDTFTIYLPEGRQVTQADAVAWLASALAAVTVAGVPEVDVTHYGGAAGTFAGGRPEVNTTHFGGTAGTFAAGRPEVNVSHWRGTAAAVPTTAGVPAVEVIDMSAAGQTDVRAAVGLAAANLDTQLDALPTAAENATAVWDRDATGHQTQGTFGQAIGDPGADPDTIWALVNTNLDATVSSRLSAAGYTAPDNAGIANIQSRLPAALVGGRMASNAEVVGDKTGYTLTSGEQDAIVDKVWDEPTAGHVAAGSTGKALTDAAAGSVDAATANKIADHVWRRTYANVRASADGDAVAFRSPLGALAKLVNKWVIAGGVLTLNHEDDVTPIGTQNVTGTPGADPITTVDTN